MKEAREFVSRRNSVKAYPSAGSYIVEKSFADDNCCSKELSVYNLLEGSPLRVARLLSAQMGKLTLSFLPGTTFVELLERQEKLGEADFAPWNALGRWLLDFYSYTGMCMTDVNLRNYLYDEQDGSVAGLDFEECATGDIKDMSAMLCAFISLYTPENTPLKQSISSHMSQWFAQNILCAEDEFETLKDRYTKEIVTRRQAKRAKSPELTRGVSAVVLAGGCSSRMGQNKAMLKFQGQTLLDYQIGKLRQLGIEDIIVSGCPTHLEKARDVSDIFPGKGPLSGIHSALLSARFEHCLVLGVDVPLVPEKTILELIRQHVANKEKITVLEHGGKLEPLIGVYEKELAGAAEEILKSDNTSIRVLFDRAHCRMFPYGGDEALLLNCNTPQEYEALCRRQKVQPSGGIHNKNTK